MARSLSWSDLRGGLVAVVVLALLAFGVLRFMRVGALHGDTFQIYALVGEARGVVKGSEVWLSGQKIGKIVDIRFRPVANADTSRRIQISMEVLAEHRSALRSDAVAQIRSGGSIVGPPVVYLTPGTMRARPLAAGDTVRTLSQGDAEGATAQFGVAAKELPAIIANVKQLREQLQSPTGTMGAMANGPGLRDVDRVHAQLTRLLDRMSSPGGSVGPIMRGGMSRGAGHVMAQVDSVRALLASNRTSLGRFRRDSTLAGRVDDIRRELAVVQASLDQSRGTVGRAMHDSALTDAVGDAKREMTLLLDDIKQHPRRYLSVTF